MNKRQLKKALAKSNIELFNTKKSKATHTSRETKISSARGIKRKTTKTGFRDMPNPKRKTTKTGANRKRKIQTKANLRGEATKRTKPITTTVKKTQQATKTYKPKKSYEKPGFGRMPKPDLHVYGIFDGRTNRGIASALNRIEREYPGTYDTLRTLVEDGDITWDAIEKNFTRYYFEDRPEGVNFNYLIDQYAVYSDGYESFMSAVLDEAEANREKKEASN